MGKAYVDPAELRRFAADLNRFNAELQHLMAGLRSKLHGLEQTWRDQEQKKFTEAFEQTAKALSTFQEAAVVHVQFLNKKAAIVEEYLKQR
jgi:WXG100 family type VII secretion target